MHALPRPARSPRRDAAPAPSAERQLTWVLLVVALAMLSFFVHLVHESVDRGERERVGRVGAPAPQVLAVNAVDRGPARSGSRPPGDLGRVHALAHAPR